MLEALLLQLREGCDMLEALLLQLREGFGYVRTTSTAVTGSARLF